MAKTTIICVEFLLDVARQKLLKSAHAVGSYSKNKSGMFLWITVYMVYTQATHEQLAVTTSAIHD